MEISHSRSSGVLVIRAWLEDGSAAELRARLISIDDVETGEETIAWAASADEVCRVVRSWLDDLASPSSPD